MRRALIQIFRKKRSKYVAGPRVTHGACNSEPIQVRLLWAAVASVAALIVGTVAGLIMTTVGCTTMEALTGAAATTLAVGVALLGLIRFVTQL